jgi:hypothetical protein
MPSLENHGGWGNRFVVHEAAKLGHLLVQSQRNPHFSRRTREMGHPAFVPVAESRVRVKKILLILAAGMPSLENHEGWGNRSVVHEAARMGQFLVEWQRKDPLLAKNARNGAPGFCPRCGEPSAS